MKVLVVAPHPDDEVLGCGGTIKKLSNQGDEVMLVVVTEAYTPEWSEEFIRARPEKVKEVCGMLGISGVEFLGFPTAKTDQLPIKDVSEKIVEAGRKFSPDVAFIPFWGDAHQDHKVVSNASLIAFRPTTSPGVKKVLAYETLSETEWGTQGFKPTVYSDITETIGHKIKAMNCYTEELKAAPHPRSVEIIESLARKRGSEAGLEFAESFVMIRSLI
jgi:LmbE family N-acetylglucosaminyl deacetylase